MYLIKYFHFILFYCWIHNIFLKSFMRCFGSFDLTFRRMKAFWREFQWYKHTISLILFIPFFNFLDHFKTINKYFSAESFSVYFVFYISNDIILLYILYYITLLIYILLLYYIYYITLYFIRAMIAWMPKIQFPSRLSNLIFSLLSPKFFF